MFHIYDKKAYIKEIQTKLHYLGYGGALLVPIDGIYGENTRLAIQSIQEANGIPSTGIVDFETHTLLHKLMRDKENSEGEEFSLSEGDRCERVREMHSYLNAIFSENRNGHIPLRDNFFDTRTKEYVNLFLLRIGEDEDGVMTKARFKRLRMEAEASFLNNC